MSVDASSELATDVAAARAELATARDELLQMLSRLGESDLDRARRGQWPIRRVLQHVLESERLYVAGLAHLQGQAQPAQSGETPDDLAGLVKALGATREVVLSLLEGASDETFYEMRPLGHEEYSVFSLLENVALHDREHAAQIEQILTRGNSA